MKTTPSFIPGETYPRFVRITEQHEGKEMVAEFNLQSYMVGMYCAMYFNGSLVNQTGDRDNKRFCKTLKADIESAEERGAIVEIEGVTEIAE